jgi:hypothetical protein
MKSTAFGPGSGVGNRWRCDVPGNDGQDPQAQFCSCKTDSWALKPEGPSPLLQQRNVDDINSRLQAKSWALADKGGVALAAHSPALQKQSRDRFCQGTEMGPAATEAETYEVGTLIVDMLDRRTQKTIWRGKATGAVAKSKEDASSIPVLTRCSARFLSKAKLPNVRPLPQNMF